MTYPPLLTVSIDRRNKGELPQVTCQGSRCGWYRAHCDMHELFVCGQVETQVLPVHREGRRVLWAAPRHHCMGDMLLGLADFGSVDVVKAETHDEVYGLW